MLSCHVVMRWRCGVRRYHTQLAPPPVPSSPSPVDVILAFLSVLVTAAPGDNFTVVAGGAEGSRAGYYANGSSNDTCSIT